MDRNHHKADSKEKYEAYFNLIHSKMEEYNIDGRHVYNMDETGFLIGVNSRSKRAFSKQSYVQKEVREALQDRSRTWITVIACICADGSALEPAIIYKGKAGLRSAWVEDIEEGKTPVFLANSPSGWTNNELGKSWVERVFHCGTKDKARSSWRLLLLDGHGSHLTRNFIEFCHANKILLLIFPPHLTHSLQPLDVVCFKTLSSEYGAKLIQHIHRCQGLLAIKKGDFFRLFWRAWNTSFTLELIRRAFEAKGVVPMDASAVLKRFTSTQSRQVKDPETGELGDRSQ
jgi:hypothetical protein